jgi:hypothetical protein
LSFLLFTFEEIFYTHQTIRKKKKQQSMTNKYSFILLSFALVFLSSCRAFYQAAPAPSPILKEKGDGNVFLSLKDAQLAYGITDHIGVVVSGHLDKSNQSLFSDTSGVISKLLDNAYEPVESKGYKSLQGGAIYFQKLDDTKSLQAGLIGGIYQPSMMIKVNRGLFKKATDENMLYKCLKADMFLNYVHTSKYIDFITTVKVSSIQYNELVYSEPLVQKELGKMTPDKYPTLKTNYFFIEPSATLQYGFDNFKFHVQGFFSQPLNDKTFAKAQLGVSWGLNYQFNVMKKQAVKGRRQRV